MTDSFSQDFRSQLLLSGLIPAGSKLLVAVSGGADSVALLYLLRGVAEEFSLQIEAAHLDHALRQESVEDADFVKQTCTQLSVPLTQERIDVGLIAREQKTGIEETARNVRHDFLLRTATVCSADLIALGHHRDDQAETFLMRLLRGTGPAGLSGMRPLSSPFVRPLLGFSRREIVAYLQACGFAWREDLSNRDVQFTRNRLRHELLPKLQEYNPNISDRLGELCDLFAREEDFWALQVSAALEEVRSVEGGERYLDCDALLQLHPALRARVVREALSEVRGDLRQLSLGHIRAVLALTESASPQADLSLPRVWVGRRYRRLWLRQDPPVFPEAISVEIAGPGEIPLPDGRRLLVSWQESAVGEDRECVEFDANSVTLPLTLRSWLPGDRMRPSGMSGRKKLQDLFVDAKLTREERSAQLLVTAAEEVLWVIGFRRTDLWPARASGKILRLTVSE